MKVTLNEDDSVRLVELAADYLRTEARSESLKPLFQLSTENQDVFGRILELSKAYLRIRRDPNARDTLSQQLQSIKLSQASIKHAVTILENLKQQLQDFPSVGYLPTFRGLRWRVDITISSSVLSRVLEPTIIMEIQLDSNKTFTFQISISKFHKLRYSTACMLKKMEVLECAVASVPVSNSV